MTSKLHPLVDEALEAHRGHDRWRKFKGIASTIRTGGKLWELKGTPLPPAQRRATSEFHRQWTQVRPFGLPDWTMTWTPERVEVIAADGTLIAERENGRDAFDRTFAGPWDPLNLAYFNGYAMWTYHATPFVFGEPNYQATSLPPIEGEMGTLRGVAFRFPENIHSHTREQHFYFGPDGLLRRHDYTVDVWADAPAAHFIYDYIDVDGLMYPTRRSVFMVNPIALWTAISTQSRSNCLTTLFFDERDSSARPNGSPPVGAGGVKEDQAIFTGAAV